MERLQVYKSKEKIGNGIYEYFFVEDFYCPLNKDGSQDTNLIMTIVGIDIETLQLALLSEKYTLTLDIFKELFDETPFMTLEQLKLKEKELEAEAWSNFPM